MVARGFLFPEGPACRGDDLFIVDMHAGCVVQIRADGSVSGLVPTGGRPNGLAFHRSGELYVADSGRGAILRLSSDGIAPVATGWTGGRFLGPNDLVFDRTGRLYFTDPGPSIPRADIGRVFCREPDGSIRIVAEGLAFPNGIALSRDERRLFVAETWTGRVLAFDRDDTGAIKGPTPYARVGGAVGPDGLALDEAGNLYVAIYGDGVIRVVSPNGVVTREWPAGGQKPTNVAFGGPQRCTAFVTEAETGAVFAFDVDIPGLRLYGDGRGGNPFL